MNEEPLKARIAKILTWKWSHSEADDVDELDHTNSPKKKVCKLSSFGRI